MPFPPSDGALFRPRNPSGVAFVPHILGQDVLDLEGVVVLVREHPGMQLREGPSTAVQAAVSADPEPLLSMLKDRMAGARSMPLNTPSATGATCGGRECFFCGFWYNLAVLWVQDSSPGSPGSTTSLGGGVGSGDSPFFPKPYPKWPFMLSTSRPERRSGNTRSLGGLGREIPLRAEKGRTCRAVLSPAPTRPAGNICSEKSGPSATLRPRRAWRVPSEAAFEAPHHPEHNRHCEATILLWGKGSS